jgi:hypothetical protein
MPLGHKAKVESSFLYYRRSSCPIQTLACLRLLLFHAIKVNRAGSNSFKLSVVYHHQHHIVRFSYTVLLLFERIFFRHLSSSVSQKLTNTNAPFYHQSHIFFILVLIWRFQNIISSHILFFYCSYANPPSRRIQPTPSTTWFYFDLSSGKRVFRQISNQ